MAEIKIERKKGLPVWALLLALVVLLLLIWAVLATRGRSSRTAPQDVAVFHRMAPVVLQLTAPPTTRTAFDSMPYVRCA